MAPVPWQSLCVRSPRKRSLVPVGLATSTRCSNPGNLSNFEFQMHVSAPAPARIGAGRVRSRVRSSTSLGSSFCIAECGGLEGGSGSVLSQEGLVVTAAFLLWEWVLATVSLPQGVFSRPRGQWDGVVLCWVKGSMKPLR